VTDLHRVAVQTRTQVVFTDERQANGQWQRPHQASAAVRTEHQRPLDPDAATAWLDQYNWAIATSEQLPTIDARAVPLYLAILEDADRVATPPIPDPADPRRGQHADVQRRAAAILHRHHPSLALTTSAGRAFPPTTGVLAAARAEWARASRPVNDAAANRGRSR